MSSIDSDQPGLNGAVWPGGAGTGDDPTAAFYRPAADATAAFYRPAAGVATAYGGSPGPASPGGGSSGPEHNGGRVKGNWWRHWTWKKALGVAGGTFAVFIVLHAGAHFYAHNNPHIPMHAVADLSSIGCGLSTCPARGG